MKENKISAAIDYAELEIITGHPIRSPGAGEVTSLIDIGEEHRAVCIDHGMGLFSVIGPIRDVHVRPGDMVTTETVLGLITSEGSSSEKIRWYLALNQAFANPLFLSRRP